MYDCNLIKSRAQKIQEAQLPDLQSMYHKMNMPDTPRTPVAPTAQIPSSTAQMLQNPAATDLPLTSPESEVVYPLNPHRPRTIPDDGTFSVPSNPFLPPKYADILDYESLQYMNGFLRTQIGSYLEIDFLVGTSNIVKQHGILKGVGLNYILLRDPIAEIDIACDFYTIKFIKVLTPLNATVDALKEALLERRKQIESEQMGKS